MSGSSKRKTGLWYGYLEAGDKSSPVVRDDRLDTGNRKTLYLFNLARGAIIEYTREIVEPKLRELKPGEAKLMDELDTAYTQARRSFKTTARTLNIPERGGSAPRKEKETADSEAGFGDFMDSDDEGGAWVDSAEEEES